MGGLGSEFHVRAGLVWGVFYVVAVAVAVAVAFGFAVSVAIDLVHRDLARREWLSVNG